MKKNLTIVLILVSIFSFGQTISGTLDNGLKNDVSYYSVVLFDSFQKIYSGQNTDGKGHFKFSNVKPGIYSIRISNVGYGDTIFENIKINNDTTVKLNIYKYCKYDNSIKNKTCPVCHKKSNVIPIIYGLPVSTNGENPMQDEGKTWKSGGCVIINCQPHWYCKNDKIEF